MRVVPDHFDPVVVSDEPCPERRKRALRTLSVEDGTELLRRVAEYAARLCIDEDAAFRFIAIRVRQLYALDDGDVESIGSQLFGLASLGGAQQAERLAPNGLAACLHLDADGL